MQLRYHVRLLLNQNYLNFVPLISYMSYNRSLILKKYFVACILAWELIHVLSLLLLKPNIFPSNQAGCSFLVFQIQVKSQFFSLCTEPVNEAIFHACITFKFIIKHRSSSFSEGLRKKGVSRLLWFQVFSGTIKRIHETVGPRHQKLRFCSVLPQGYGWLRSWGSHFACQSFMLCTCVDNQLWTTI